MSNAEFRYFCREAEGISAILLGYSLRREGISVYGRGWGSLLDHLLKVRNLRRGSIDGQGRKPPGPHAAIFYKPSISLL